MPNIDVTRIGKFNQKRTLSYAVIRINDSNRAQFSSGAHLAFILPPNCLTVDGWVYIDVLPAAPFVTKLGTTEGGAEFLVTGTPSAIGKIGTFASQKKTIADTPVYLDLGAAPVTGELTVVLAYLEMDKTTGELTKKSPV